MGYRARKLAAALVAAAAVVIGQPLVATLHSLDKGTGARDGGDLAIAEVGDCHRYGPWSHNGLGHHWSCEVAVRTADRRVEHVVVDRSIVTPADAGRQLRFHESCDDDGCVYGRASPEAWSTAKNLMHLVLEWLWRVFALCCLFGVATSLIGAVAGRHRTDRLRDWLRRNDSPEVDLPGPRITARRTDAPGLTVDLIRPEAALYLSARPVLTIDAGESIVADWGVRTVPVRPGRRYVEIVVVTRSLALHTSRARIGVRVGRRRGAAVTYRPPDLDQSTWGSGGPSTSSASTMV